MKSDMIHACNLRLRHSVYDTATTTLRHRHADYDTATPTCRLRHCGYDTAATTVRLRQCGYDSVATSMRSRARPAMPSASINLQRISALHARASKRITLRLCRLTRPLGLMSMVHEPQKDFLACLAGLLSCFASVLCRARPHRLQQM